MDTIRIFAPSEKLKVTALFYSDGLGLKEAKPCGRGKRVFLSEEGQLLELVPLSGPLMESRTCIRFHVHGLEECLRYLVSQGHLLEVELQEPLSDRREIDLTDPAGNLITLIDASCE